ncbi:hypothetical protein HDU86_008213 [Geranomyces michiganensis]|nr:hypothetical protein HDU86_008213 [Geranomyces michiganensis]
MPNVRPRRAAATRLTSGGGGGRAAKSRVGAYNTRSSARRSARRGKSNPKLEQDATVASDSDSDSDLAHGISASKVAAEVEEEGEGEEIEEEEELTGQDSVENESTSASPDGSLAADDDRVGVSTDSENSETHVYPEQMPEGLMDEEAQENNDDDFGDDDEHDTRPISRMDPRAQPESAIIGITATYLIACEITSSLSCAKKKLKFLWETLVTAEQYKQFINEIDCTFDENVRRAKLLAAFELWQNMQRCSNSAELIARRPQLIDELVDLIGTKLPQPSLYESNRTAKILVNLLTQKYIALKLAAVGENNSHTRTAHAHPLEEDTDFLTMWEQGGHPVDEQRLLSHEKRVEHDIRTHTVTELARIYSWLKCLRQIGAFLVEIGENTEHDVDLDVIAAAVKRDVFDSQRSSSASGNSEDERLDDDYRAGSSGSSHHSQFNNGDGIRPNSVGTTMNSLNRDGDNDNGADTGPDHDRTTNGRHWEEAEDDDDDDNFQMNAALLGELVADIQSRENALAAAHTARKGKGRVSAEHASERMTPTPNPSRARRTRRASHENTSDGSHPAPNKTRDGETPRVTRGRTSTPSGRTSSGHPKAGLTANETLRGLESAGRQLRRDVQDPIERLYPAVDLEFPRQSPRLREQRRSALSSRTRRAPAELDDDESSSSYNSATNSPPPSAQKRRKRNTSRWSTPAPADAARSITPSAPPSPPRPPRSPSSASNVRQTSARPEAAAAAATPAERAAPRSRCAWAEEDVAELERGLIRHHHKYACWRMILNDGLARGRFAGRTNVMLKDKARQMKQARSKAGLPLGGFEWALDRVY